MPNENEGAILQLVVFSLNGEEYAFPIEEIEEIQEFITPVAVPGAPDFIYGIINLRGKIVVLLDIKKRFSLPGASMPSHMIIIDTKNTPFGVVVDKIGEVLKVHPSEIKSSPKLLETKIDGRYIKGVLVKGKRVIIILDPKKLVADEEIMEARSNA